MEEYRWTGAQEQICNDNEKQSSSSIIACHASYNDKLEDDELARKKKELQFIEEKIARKRAAIALKNEWQRTSMYSEKDVDKESNNDIEVKEKHETSSGNNFPQRQPHQEAVHLTARQISILNELTPLLVSSFEVSSSAITTLGPHKLALIKYQGLFYLIPSSFLIIIS